MSEEKRERVTRLERDVWVSAFGFSAAWGHREPEYWAAAAVLRLRRTPEDGEGKVRPTPEFVVEIRRGVEEFEKQTLARRARVRGVGAIRI